MVYLVIKSLHLIAMVSWFAGLLYLVRLFVYHTEAFDRPKPEQSVLRKQYELMELRLLRGIASPAMLLTLGLGFTLLFLNPSVFGPWLGVKLILVGVLMAYHMKCALLRKRLIQKPVWKSSSLRAFNELATLLLVSMVLIAVTKDPLMGLYGVGGFFLFGGVIILFLKGKQKILPPGRNGRRGAPKGRQ